jgi:hypothetical protein
MCDGLLLSVIPVPDVCNIVQAYAASFSGQPVPGLHIRCDTPIQAIESVSNTRLAVSCGKTVLIFDVTSSQMVRTIQQRGGVTCMTSMTPNLLACAGKRKLKIWDLDSGRCWSTLTWHESNLDVRALLATDHGLGILRMYDDLEVWDVLTHKRIHTLGLNAHEVASNRSQIAAIFRQDMRLFDARTGATLCVLPFTGVRFALCALPESSWAFAELVEDGSPWNVKKASELYVWRPQGVAKTAVRLPPCFTFEMVAVDDCVLTTHHGEHHLVDLEQASRVQLPTREFTAGNGCAVVGDLVALIDSQTDVYFYQ